ncbi:transposase [Streptomyces sp. NPDC057486]|uniref:IS110 family transposase n=1 Tax=Streptomyces sp. NPDC057486 TaxID=3346145 RepID=UPI0036B58B19
MIGLRRSRCVEQCRRGRPWHEQHEHVRQDTVGRIGAGNDSGKEHHHGLALDADGKTLLSARVTGDGPEPLQLIGDVHNLAGDREVTWAIDMTDGEPALLPALRGPTTKPPSNAHC